MPNTTTSTSFSTVQTLFGVKQYPKREVQLLVYAHSGTTGTVQLVDQSSNVLWTRNLTMGTQLAPEQGSRHIQYRIELGTAMGGWFSEPRLRDPLQLTASLPTP